MNMKISYLLVGILLLTASCTKVVDLEDLRPDPKLVLNCVASPGEPLKASLSRTWFYTEDYPNVTIEDARLNLYVNDRFVQEMDWEVEETEYYATGNYVSSYIPVAGDKIRIEASRDGFKSVSGEETVLPKPALLGFSASEINRDDRYDYNYKRKIQITFKDPPAAGDCYLLRLSSGWPKYEYETSGDHKPVYTGEYYWYTESMDYATEPIFGNQISIIDKVFGNDWLSGNNGRPFSDELINGKEYTINIESTSYYIGNTNIDPSEQMPDSIRVYLYSISESYYKYLSAVISLYDGTLNSDLASAGLAEPVRVFNNIKGGLGIMGTASVDSLTVAVTNTD